MYAVSAYTRRNVLRNEIHNVLQSDYDIHRKRVEHTTNRKCKSINSYNILVLAIVAPPAPRLHMSSQMQIREGSYSSPTDSSSFFTLFFSSRFTASMIGSISLASKLSAQRINQASEM